VNVMPRVYGTRHCTGRGLT